MELDFDHQIQAPMSQEMINFMRSNLLKEAMTSEINGAKDLSRVPSVQKNTVDCRKLTKNRSNAAFMNSGNVNDLRINLEPETRDFEIENVRLDVPEIPPAERKLIVRLENLKVTEKNGKFIIEARTSGYNGPKDLYRVSSVQKNTVDCRKLTKNLSNAALMNSGNENVRLDVHKIPPAEHKLRVLLENVNIIEKNGKSIIEARTSGYNGPKDLYRVPSVQKNPVDCRKVTKNQSNAGLLGIENSDLILKLEEIDDFEIENVPLDVPIHPSSGECINQERNLIIPLENLKVTKKNGKYVIGHQHHTAALSRHKDHFLNRNISVKIETSNGIDDVQNIHDITYEEWKIKNEELDIKEDVEQNETSMLIRQAEHKKNRTVHEDQLHFDQTRKRKFSNRRDYQSFKKSKSTTHRHLNPDEVNMFKCYHCDYQSNRKYTLTYHLRKHMSQRKVNMFKCDHCKFQTIYKKSLKNHLHRHQNPDEVNMFKCDQCDYQNNMKANLKSHLRKHMNPENVKMFKCDQCDYQSIWKNNLKSHLRNHMNPDKVKMFKCNQCTFQNFYKATLKRHLLQHDNPGEVNMYKCNQCEFQTIYKHSFKRHRREHENPEGVNMYKCDQCIFQTNYKASFRFHLLRHKNPEEVNMFKCDQCKYQTIDKYCLKLHLVQHQDPMRVTMLKCDRCKFQTIYKKSLKTHLLRHQTPDEVNMFKCDQCDYQSNQKRYLRTHVLKHMNPEKVNMFKCNQCKYQTIYKNRLWRHRQRHKEVKRYKCDQCNFATIYSCNLRDHLIRHNPNKLNMNYCDLCKYQTISKPSLKRHLRKHVNPEDVLQLCHKNPEEVNMFKCDECEFQTMQERYLTRHLRWHKSYKQVAMYQCDQCNYECMQKQTLKKHFLSHNTVEVNTT